jgi:hypothetical protein
MSESPDHNRRLGVVEPSETIATVRSTLGHAPARGPGPGRREEGTVLTAGQSVVVPSRSVRWSLQLRASAVRRARVLVRYTLITWDLEPLADDAELLVSELTTNAVRYGAGLLSVHLVVRDRLLCEVGDDERTLPMLRHPLPDSDSGRGLHLVDQLAARWGSTRTRTGKLVWFELHLPTDL